MRVYNIIYILFIFLIIVNDRATANPKEDIELLSLIIEDIKSETNKFFKEYDGEICGIKKHIDRIEKYFKIIQENPSLLEAENLEKISGEYHEYHKNFQFILGHRKSFNCSIYSAVTFPIYFVNAENYPQKYRARIAKNMVAYGHAWIESFNNFPFKFKFIYHDPDQIVNATLNQVYLMLVDNYWDYLNVDNIDAIFKAMYYLESPHSNHFHEYIVKDKQSEMVKRLQSYGLKNIKARGILTGPSLVLLSAKLRSTQKAELIKPYIENAYKIIKAYANLFSDAEKLLRKETSTELEFSIKCSQIKAQISDLEHLRFLLLTSCILKGDLDLEYRNILSEMSLVPTVSNLEKLSKYIGPYLLKVIDEIDELCNKHNLQVNEEIYSCRKTIEKALLLVDRP